MHVHVPSAYVNQCSICEYDLGYVLGKPGVEVWHNR